MRVAADRRSSGWFWLVQVAASVEAALLFVAGAYLRDAEALGFAFVVLLTLGWILFPARAGDSRSSSDLSCLPTSRSGWFRQSSATRSTVDRWDRSPFPPRSARRLDPDLRSCPPQRDHRDAARHIYLWRRE